MWRNLWKKLNPMDLGFREEEELGFVILDFSEDEEEYENGDLDHSLSLWQIVHLSDPKSEARVEKKKKEETMDKVKDFNSDEPGYESEIEQSPHSLDHDDADDDDDYIQEDPYEISQSEYENLTKPRVKKSNKRTFPKIRQSRINKKPSKRRVGYREKWEL